MLELLSVGSGSGESDLVVAVLATLPVASGFTRATIVTVRTAPGAMSPSEQSIRGPVAAQSASGLTVFSVTLPGSVSVTVALTAVDGPSLVTTIVQWMSSPATTLASAAALTIRRSAATEIGVVVVGVLLPGCGSGVSAVAVAVFTSGPVTPGATVPVRTIGCTSPGASVGNAHSSRWPSMAHCDGVTVAGTKPAGRSSVTSVSTAVEGPLLRSVKR